MNDSDTSGYIGLGLDINKQSGEITPETQEGIVSEKLPELTLSMDNTNIAKLTQKWEKAWNESEKKQEWEKQIKENEEYWLGKQFDKPKADKSRPQVDNLIFEALETYLPQTTRRNPEPLVAVHSSAKSRVPNPVHELYVEKVKNRLTDLADENKLRLKLKTSARHWAIYHLGVTKFGWDLDKDMPVIRVIRAKRLILDADATISEDGYTGDRIGEHRKLKASTILAIIGNGDGTQEAITLIKEKSKDNEATEIGFIEWWTPEFLAWTMGKTVLLKKKNPHWNYDRTSQEVSVDTFGNETPSEEEVPGVNHFPVPRMPYTFLSVFQLGDQPMDKTGLIQQNLSNQDLINKRNKQIDKNADKMNGGAVVSLARSGLSQSQAKNVVRAVRDGGAVLIPDGSPQDAVYFPQVPSLPGDVYNQLLDTRSRLRDIFGTSGSTPAGVKQEDTVRGKIQIRGLDTDRIGGGVSEYLEQYADDIYNWFVQLLYVYDEDFQMLDGNIPPKLTISVKEGSLLPKDSISIANQALELARMNKISNIDLYKRLEYPNPDELAANVWLEANAPHILYKDNQMVQEALGLLQPQAEEQAPAAEVPQNQIPIPEITEEGAGAPDRSTLPEVPITAG